MSAIDDGGPAFPTGGWKPVSNTPMGMSLRSWLAGQALAGICANATSGQFKSVEDGARHAVKLADAMIAALKGGQQ